MSDSISSPKYPTWASAARSIWREGGVKAVYRGFVPCILRAFPTVSEESLPLSKKGEQADRNSYIEWRSTLRVGDEYEINECRESTVAKGKKT